jgi:hypothetical protein
VPAEATSCKDESNVYNEYSELHRVGEDEIKEIVDIFSIHSRNETGTCPTCLNVIKYYSN